MSGIEVTYICGQTGQKVLSSDGLPEGWIIPTHAIAREGEERPIPPKYSVVAFSSKAAMDRYMEVSMSESFAGVKRND